MASKTEQTTKQSKKTIGDYLPVFTGRITRKQYLISLGILWITALVIVLFQELHPLTAVLAFPLCIAFVILLFSISIRRLHDLNQPGWIFIGLFLPFANIILSIYILFWPGKDEKNKYGSRLSKDAGVINYLLGK